MGIGNLLEVIVHYLLIGGTNGLGHPNRFSMMSTLVYMITHWIGLTVSRDLRLSSNYDLTKLFHCVISQP